MTGIDVDASIKILSCYKRVVGTYHFTATNGEKTCREGCENVVIKSTFPYS